MAARGYIMEFYPHWSIFKSFIKKRCFKYFCILFQKDLGKRREISDIDERNIDPRNFTGKRMGRTGPGFSEVGESSSPDRRIWGSTVHALLSSAFLPPRICPPSS